MVVRVLNRQVGWGGGSGGGGSGIPGGGHWPRKGVWGCAVVMTPFFQASRRSLAYQFTIIAPLLCPPFSNFRKFFHFQPCFGQNFSSQDVNFPNFRSLDPSFFKGNPLPRPYFWKSVWHIPTKKKSWVPPRERYVQVLWEIKAILVFFESNHHIFATIGATDIVLVLMNS